MLGKYLFWSNMHEMLEPRLNENLTTCHPKLQTAENCGIFKFRAREIGGPYENLGEITGADGQSFGFRSQMKRHPVDGAILMVVDGYAFNVEEGDFGYGFVLLRFHTGEHL